MNHFICFFRGGTGNEDWAEWIATLKARNRLIRGAPLVKDGKISLQNGDVVKDFVFDIADNARGFAIIAAQDINEAIQITNMCPVFNNDGNITIRPIDTYF